MQYKLTDDQKTWCFADRHNLAVEPFDLKAQLEYPAWIPGALCLDEPGADSTAKAFDKFLKTEFGVVIAYLFKYTAYHLPIRNDVKRIGKKAINSSLNTSGNRILTSSDGSIEELIEELLNTTELPFWGTKAKGELLSMPLATMFIRWFNYYECQNKRVDHLFNMRPRTLPMATCPACQTEFTNTGAIITPPSVDVDVATWQDDFALPGGFGWIPGGSWEDGDNPKRNMRRD